MVDRRWHTTFKIKRTYWSGDGPNRPNAAEQTAKLWRFVTVQEFKYHLLFFVLDKHVSVVVLGFSFLKQFGSIVPAYNP